MTLGVEFYRALHPVLSRVSTPSDYPTSENASIAVGATFSGTITYSAVNSSPQYEQGSSAPLAADRPIWLYSFELAYTSVPSPGDTILDLKLETVGGTRIWWLATGILRSEAHAGFALNRFSLYFPFPKPIYLYDTDGNGRVDVTITNRGPVATGAWGAFIAFSTGVF